MLCPRAFESSPWASVIVTNAVWLAPMPGSVNWIPFGVSDQPGNPVVTSHFRPPASRTCTTFPALENPVPSSERIVVGPIAPGAVFAALLMTGQPGVGGGVGTWVW